MKSPGPIKILYVIPTVGTGGSEIVVANLLERLAPLRFHSSACAFEDGPLRARFAAQGNRFYPLFEMNSPAAARTFKIINNVSRVRKLRRVIQQNRPAIVHSHHFGALVNVYLATLGLRPKPMFVHTEHVRPDVDPTNSARVMALVPYILRRVRMITGVSQMVSQYFVDEMGFSPETVRTISNGIDLAKFSHPHDPAACKEMLGIPQDSKVLTVVGNLRKQKNHAALVRAMPEILRAYPSCYLLIVGTGPEEKAIRSLIGTLNLANRVLLLRTRDDIPEILAATDVYCLPSLFEGMPLTILEAMAAGKPIVSTNVHGCRDIVEHEKTGFLVPPDQPGELAAAIIRLFSDPDLARSLGETSRTMVLKTYGLDKMALAYANLYEFIYTNRKFPCAE